MATSIATFQAVVFLYVSLIPCSFCCFVLFSVMDHESNLNKKKKLTLFFKISKNMFNNQHGTRTKPVQFFYQNGPLETRITPA